MEDFLMSYDFPSVVLGFDLFLITGIVIGIINLLFESALHIRAKRKFLKKELEEIENEQTIKK